MTELEGLTERFLTKTSVNTVTGCQEWTEALDSSGYGQFRVGRKKRTAHRVSYEIHFGPVPDGMCVLHRCDNRACVNPEHLFLGTNGENMADRNIKGRQACRSSHGRAKLTEADIIAIRSSTGLPQKVLAERYGVDYSQIWRIRSGRQWR
jgi:hypothetical protein